MEATIKPGVQTSEFKLALVSVAATVALTAIKGLGVALAASGQWWAIPASLALTSAGYSLSRALVKRGVSVPVAAAVTDGGSVQISG